MGSLQPKFSVDIECQEDILAMDFSDTGFPRNYTLTVDEDSDPDIARRFKHELNEFLIKFCHPEYPGLEELHRRLVEDEEVEL